MPETSILRPTALFSNISTSLTAAMVAGGKRTAQETTVIGAFRALVETLDQTHAILGPVIRSASLKSVMILICQMNLADWASPAHTFLDDVFQYDPASKLQRKRSDDQKKRANIASTLWRKATAQKTDRTDSDRFDAALKALENLLTRDQNPYSPNPEQVATLATLLSWFDWLCQEAPPIEPLDEDDDTVPSVNNLDHVS